MTHDDMPCGFESYENDWLEVKYATPEQMQEEQKQENAIKTTFAKAKQKTEQLEGKPKTEKTDK